MNQAIRDLERDTVKRHGLDADRFLDDIGNLVGSDAGISSKRNVSTFLFSVKCILIFTVVEIQIFYR